MNQVLEIGEKLTHEERTRMFRLIKAYERTPSPALAHLLEAEYGFVIDVKDHGAEQGVERGADYN